MSNHYRAVIFDLDGVLADSEGLHILAWQQLFAALGLPFETRWSSEWVGVPDSEIATMVAGRFSVRIGATELLNRKRHQFRALVRARLKPFEGTAAELQRCACCSVPMAIGTSSVRAEASLMLKVLGFHVYFPVIVAGDDVSRIKPAPDIYLEAARRLDVPPAQCIVLEDSPAGITAALEADMAVVAVATSFAPYQLKKAAQVFAAPAKAIHWLCSNLNFGTAGG